MAQNRQALIEAHPGKADLILAWQERWDEMFDGPVERMDRLFEETRALGLKQYALSNLPAEKWPPLRAMYPFLDRLDAAVITGEEGVIKPDPAIFEITKARIATAPEETLFIDDRAENIAAGERAGFPGLVFEGEAKLRRDLARLGVKLAPPGGG
ncbi:HAD family phosphatase [Marinicauda algicola]|uniref:HAD family phosphatase n=2 Tax=Marinicauda algicola TaxID=2029849 RepID=A0A4S2H5F3_9PROT|nr:HAD family phosphatase [Marinicauda algicola]